MIFVTKKPDRLDKIKNTNTIRHVIFSAPESNSVTTVSTIAKQMKESHFPFERVIFLFV